MKANVQEVYPDRSEAIYGSMLRFGLATVCNYVPLKIRENSVRERLEKL